MKRWSYLCLVLFGTAACDGDDDVATARLAPTSVPSVVPTATAPIQPRALPRANYARTHLRWKRFRVLQNDLARALALPERELCTERTGDQCAAGGIVTLKDWLRNEKIPESQIDEECKKRQGGGSCNENVGPYIPIDNPRGAHVVPLGGNNALLGGVFEPLAEPIVTTPIVTERYVLMACSERAARDVTGTPTVFVRFDIRAPVISAASAGTSDTVTDLYKRLLARSPTDTERTAIVGMLEGSPMRGEDFARLACFAIATQPEFIFQ
jgi:hypothetical protein